ncbi:M1 family metallopeptidase [Streptomyces sp. NPDC059913]|uniref:M1 family metallopeptidase n=1 Tax=unclassified Streptomyces TaxID=2593676 RepID=UPI0036680854
MNHRTPVRRTVLATLALLVLVTSTGCSGGVEGRPGAAGVGDPFFPRLGNGGYDVTHYDLALDVDPAAHRLRGTATLTARATRDLSAFHLDLLGLTVESATVDGRPAAVSRAGQKLTLRPDAGVRLSEGYTFRTVIRYAGSPRPLTDPDGSREGWLWTADGAVALGEPAGSMTWFPGNDHPSDKASYDIAVTVPKGLTAVSNGEPAPPVTSAGRTTYRWHVGEPMASYLATVAVGHFETKDTKKSKEAGGIEVFTAADRTVAADSAPALARVPETVAWAARRFGPYPFASTGAIVGRTGDAGYALETQNRPFFPGPPSPRLLVHEMAHQWFGDSVTPASWRDTWLNEGFATYAEWLWAADKEGVPVGDSFDAAFRKDVNWAFPPADPPTAADILEPPVYGRGAMAVHEIRRAVGDDTRFFALLKGWTGAHRHGNASTADFTAYVERATGRDLGALWKTWLYGRSRPAPQG